MNLENLLFCIRMFLVPAVALFLAGVFPALAQQAKYLDHRADPSWDVTRARGETYEIDFTTEEGTWMSVDISTAGDWIVFDLLGSIYRVPARGGNAQNLTEGSGIALNFHPPLLSGRKPNRFHLRSGRSGQPVDDECGWIQSRTGLSRPGHAVEQSRVDA